jgi:hypothetical protein
LFLVALEGCSNEQCLEVKPTGTLPARTDWVIWTGQAPGQAPDRAGGSQGVTYPSSDHLDFCSSPATEDVEGYLIRMWFDASEVSPFERYCQDLQAGSCQPQAGQPRGETVITLKANGRTEVQVPVAPP